MTSSFLILSNKNLVNVPEELVSAKDVRHLWLDRNKITHLQYLPSQLISLNASHNNLKLINFPLTLQKLKLNTCALTELSALEELTQLTWLELHDNKFDVIPNYISKLHKLQHLSLHDNSIRYIPKEISSLQRLEWLSLHSNKISMLPPEIGLLSSLESLSLHCNDLIELPNEFGSLTKLNVLSLFSNKLLYIPKEVFIGLQDCKRLSLCCNKLRYLPHEITEMRSLREIWLYDNDFIAEPVFGPNVIVHKRHTA